MVKVNCLMTQHFSKSELHIAWRVLEQLQNDIPINETMSLQALLERFNFIEDLKQSIDVRSTTEKLSQESLLSPLYVEEKLSRNQNLSPHQNNLLALYASKVERRSLIKASKQV